MDDAIQVRLPASGVETNHGCGVVSIDNQTAEAIALSVHDSVCVGVLGQDLRAQGLGGLDSALHQSMDVVGMSIQYPNSDGSGVSKTECSGLTATVQSWTGVPGGGS